MKELYKLLVEMLREAEGIKWIDFDYGQIDGQDAAKYPCALIKLTASNKDVDEAGSQSRRWTIRLRLAFDATGAKTSAAVADAALERSLAWSSIVADVYSLLQGVAIGEFTPLECTDEGQEDRRDGKYVYGFIFVTTDYVYK